MANMNFGVNILPKANNTYTLGNSDYKWNIFANTINGASVLTDVQVSGTSIVNNGVASLPEATTSQYGLVRLFSGGALQRDSTTGAIKLDPASSAEIKAATSGNRALAPYRQHESVFYGLAKAAGDSTQSASSNAVGTYTSQAQSAIRNMLAAAPKSSPFFTGAISLGRYNNKTDQSDEANTIGFYSIAVGNNIAASGESSQAFGQDTYAVGWTAHAEGRDTAAYGNMSHTEGIYTLTEDGAWASHAEGSDTIANTPCVHVSGQYNSITDLSLAPTWTANTSYTVGDIVKHEETNDDDETHNYVYRCITANNDATFDYGKWITWEDVGDFAEIIGNGGYINDDPLTELRSNARALDWQGNEYLNGYLYVGCNANSGNGIRVPHDIQINGTSIVSNGIANIPLAARDTLGAVMINGYGLWISSENGLLATNRATLEHIKAGTQEYRPIVPYNQHEAVFYGLAKAAGDSTQSASSNAVGVYTDSAKTAIQNMLNVASKTFTNPNIRSVAAYGAVGDGITDDSTAIQSAIDAGYEIYFDSNKTYYIASPISIHHDVYIHGGKNTVIKTKTPSGDTVNNGLMVTGTLKKTTTLTSDYTSTGTGDNCENRFTLSDMTDIAIGDIMVVEAEDQYYSYARPYYHLGGTLLITDIYNGHLYTSDSFPWDITNSQDVTVKIYNAPQVVIENIDFISDLDSIGAYVYLLYMANCKHSDIKNCTFSNMANGIMLKECVNTKIDNITFAKSKYDNTLNGDGYGMIIDSCTNTMVERVLATCAQHAIDISGHLPAMNSYIKNCDFSAECRQPGFDTHESTYNLVIEDCVLGGASICGTAKINRCKFISNRRVTDGTTDLTLYGSHNKKYANFVITNCEFMGTGITLYHLSPQNPVQTFDVIFDNVEIDHCSSIGQISLVATSNATLLSHTVNHFIIKNSDFDHIYNVGNMIIKELFIEDSNYHTAPMLSNHNSMSMTMTNIEYFDYQNTACFLHNIRINRDTHGESLILPGDSYINLTSNNANAQFMICGRNVVSNDISDYCVGIVGGSAGGSLSRSAAGSGAPTIAFNSDGDMVYSQGSNSGQYCVYPFGLFYVKEVTNISFSAQLFNTGSTNAAQFRPLIAVVDCSTGKLLDRYSGSVVTATSEGATISYNHTISSNTLAMCYLYCSSPVSGAETTIKNWTVNKISSIINTTNNNNEKFIANRRIGDGVLRSLPGINNIICSEISFHVDIRTEDTDSCISLATQNNTGLMNYNDKIKLDSIMPMTGATSSIAGASGLVPAPATTDVDKFLAGDGTYKSGGLPMVILSYGSSTWNDFINAYNNNVIVYCRASSNSNPATGSQTRMAFMAYVNNATTPTEVEFQYYRSMSSHSATAMGDQVFVYKLTKTGGWSVTTRDASIKQIKADTGTALGVSWSSNVITLTNTMTADDMPMSSSDATTAKAAIDGKININQGVANAGKFLVVNSSGNVEAITLQEWQGGNY